MTKRIENTYNGEDFKPLTSFEQQVGRMERKPKNMKLQTADPSGYGKQVWPTTLVALSPTPMSKADFNEQYLQQPRRAGKRSDFNKLATMIHADNVKVGWWDDPDRCLLEVLQMVSTEIAEATEGERKDLMDDKLKHRKMGEVELADTLIRVLDLGGKLGLEYQANITCYYSYGEMLEKINSTKSIAGKHFVINIHVVKIHEFIGYLDVEDNERPMKALNVNYSLLIESIMEVGKFRGYDIISALHEKLTYNRHRLDHKRENRAEKHGKKF